jgi:hypothetical protein
VKHIVRYRVELHGEFQLEAGSKESLLKAMQDIAEAARLVPLFTGLGFENATSEDVVLSHEIVEGDAYVSLRSGDEEIEAC